jgi:hypothetical protein
MRGFMRDVHRGVVLCTTVMEYASEFVIKAAKLSA